MDASLRELAECRVGTHDFHVGLVRDPKITLTRLDHVPGVSEAEAESAVEPSAERCASLYDAIREMGTYGSEIEARRRRSDGDDLLYRP